MPRALIAIPLLLLTASFTTAAEPFHYPEAKHGKGELRYINGVPVLIAVGTPEEIGEQIGVLAVKPLAEKFKLLKEILAKRGVSLAWPILVRACEGLFSKFPEDYRKEVEAMAKAGGVDREALIVANCVADIQHLGGCSAFIVEPARSSTDELLYGRNMDSAPVGDIPLIGLVVVRRPAGKHAFVSVGYPGVLMIGSEMNDAGVCLGGNDARGTKDGSPKLEPAGTPMAVTGRRLMEEGASLADAERLLKDYKSTTSGNAVVCDKEHGAVFEITPKTVAIRRAEDGLCLCTNHFRTKELAEDTQCWRYEVLEKLRDQKKFGVDDVEKALDAVNQKAWTSRSMVFEPAALRIHVAMGPGPATKLPYKTIELAPVFRGEK